MSEGGQRTGRCPICGRRLRCLPDEWLQCPLCDREEEDYEEADNSQE